ncbi:MAG: hypothetical protein ACJAV1_003285 [Paraglaciecola sp.]|jgi:hypothetical protein
MREALRAKIIDVCHKKILRKGDKSDLTKTSKIAQWFKPANHTIFEW